MSDSETLHIELDEEAVELLTQLKGEYASRLLSRAVDAAGGAPCKITAAGIRSIAAFGEAAEETVGTPLVNDEPALADERLGILRMLFVLGSSVLIGSGVALGAVLIPSVVHDDTSRILIGVAMLGTAAVLIGVTGLILVGHSARTRASAATSAAAWPGRSWRRGEGGSAATVDPDANPLAADPGRTGAEIVTSDAASSDVPYQKSTDYAWTEKAFEMLESSHLHGEVFVSREGVVSSRVRGPCPRCWHVLDDRRTQTAVTNLMGGDWHGPGGAGPGQRGGSDTGLEFFPVDVSCGCGDSHAGAPAGTTGCGVSFRVELSVQSTDGGEP